MKLNFVILFRPNRNELDLALEIEIFCVEYSILMKTKGT